MTRYIEIRMVEDIEEFTAHFGFIALRYSESLAHIQVDILARRSTKHGARRVAELKARGMCESGGIEIALQRPCRSEIRVACKIRPHCTGRETVSRVGRI